MRNPTRKILCLATVLAAGALLAPHSALAQQSGPPYGPGYGMMGQGWAGGQGPGYGMMRPGWGGGPGPGYGMMGPGMMGPGMMGPGMMGQGWGMMGPGMMGPGWGMMGQTAPIDANRDGIVAAGEAADHFEAVFAAADFDDDGTVTAEEYAGRPCFGPCRNPQARFGQDKDQFTRMDADKDGKVTHEEFLKAMEAAYTKADANNDGKVTVWEFRIARHKL